MSGPVRGGFLTHTVYPKKSDFRVVTLRANDPPVASTCSMQAYHNLFETGAIQITYLLTTC